MGLSNWFQLVCMAREDLHTCIPKRVTREELPRLTVCDIKEVEISEELCFTLPKSGILLIDPPFDGKVVVRRNGKVKNVVKLSGGTRCEISGIIFGTVLELYQGCDLIKVINFKREEVAAGYLQDDNEVLKRLQNAGGFYNKCAAFIRGSAI